MLLKHDYLGGSIALSSSFGDPTQVVELKHGRNDEDFRLDRMEILECESLRMKK